MCDVFGGDILESLEVRSDTYGLKYILQKMHKYTN